MNRAIKRISTPVLVLSVAALTACGGSGNNDSVFSSANAPVITTAGPSFGTAPGVALWAEDPALETPMAVLDEALVCTVFDNPERNPVLLVHGTFTNGPEQYNPTYIPFLENLGFDVCVTTYPDRGLGDQQTSAEYVVYAVLRIQQQTGQLVDMAGHSQGGSMPRWAIRWWPSVRDALDDFVMHAGVNHGTTMGSSGGGGESPEAFFQFSPDSNFVAALNSLDETPGDIEYTSIYTVFDELVQPQPVPPTGTEEDSSSALDRGQSNPNVANFLLQDLCPGRAADHVTIGLSDSLTAQLTVDAFINDGPADFDRAGGLVLCAQQSFNDAQGATIGLIGQGPAFFSTIPTDAPMSSEEPPLRPYAQSGVE